VQLDEDVKIREDKYENDSKNTSKIDASSKSSSVNEQIDFKVEANKDVFLGDRKYNENKSDFDNKNNDKNNEENSDNEDDEFDDDDDFSDDDDDDDEDDEEEDLALSGSSLSYKEQLKRFRMVHNDVLGHSDATATLGLLHRAGIDWETAQEVC
jgi:hypothetical protein